MAKQTFTTGQVLTSAQMTALQLNDYNQTVSAKVASYTLVAADAGTRITMSNAGATTITVNTSLFTAGDTLFITNIGAGACTITAGTATVSTASSLVLAQYDSGRLYFTSTGVAIWEKYAGASAAGALTLLSTTSLTGASTTISVAGGYKDLQVFISGVTNATASGYFRIAPNGTTNAASSIENYAELTTASAGATNGGYIALTSFALRTDANNAAVLYISNYASAATYKPYNYRGGFLGTGNYQSFTQSGIFKDITAITSLVISNSGGNLSTGTVLVYGVN